MPADQEWAVTLDHWPPGDEFTVPRDGLEAARIGHRVRVTVEAEDRTGRFVDLAESADGTLGLTVRFDDSPGSPAAT
ncbi:MAG: hypothetical protein ACLGIZ_13915 [Acidimicrobiia bacterium]